MNFEQRKQIVNQTNQKFYKEQWYRGSSCDPDNMGQLVLEFRVNYIPILQRKEVISYAQALSLPYRFTIVDKNGNRVE